MPRLHETIDTALPIDDGLRLRRRLRQRRAVGIRASPPPNGSTPDPSGSARGTGSASGCAAGSRRWSTGSPPSSPLGGSSWRARARASTRSTRSASSRRGRDRDPHRLHRRHPAARLDAARAAVRRRDVRPDREGRARRHAASARRRSPRRRRDEGRGHRGRGQRPDRGLRPPRRRPRRRAVRARADAGRARGDGRRSRRRLARSTSTRASSSTTSRPTLGSWRSSTSSASRPSRATCRSPRPAARARSSSARAASAGSSPSRASPCDRRTCGCSRTSPGSTARRGRSSTDPEPTGLTLGDFLAERRVRRAHSATTSSSRSPRRSGRPRPGRTLEYPLDYLLRFLDNHGLIGMGRALPWRTVTRRVADAMSTGSSRRSPAGPCRSGDPVTAVAARRRGRRPCGPTPGTSERFDAVVMATHADVARRLCSHDADPGERGGARRVRLQPQRGRAPHGRAGHAAATGRLVVVERRPGRLRPARPGGDDDLSHEPAPGAARPGRLLRLGQSRRPGPRRAGHPRAVVRPPALHVPNARRRRPPSAGSRAIATRGTPGAHLGFGFHEDGCRSGFDAAAMIGTAEREAAA